MRLLFRIILAGAITLTLLLAAFVAWTVIYNDNCRKELAQSYLPFDAREWLKAGSPLQSASGSFQEYRVLAIEDLLARYDFKGWTRSQVVTLLGEPGPTDKFQNFDMVYWLGPDRSCMRIDSEWLVLSLKNDRVGHYFVTSD